MKSPCFTSALSAKSGWLLDLYPGGEAGLKVWMLTDQDERLCLEMDFPVTFYAAGDFSMLRQTWVYLREKDCLLARERRRDLFSGDLDVLAITVPRPEQVRLLYYDLTERFPMLDLYDADIPLSLRFAARYKVYPLGRFSVDENSALCSLDSCWDLAPLPTPLRTLILRPNTDPAQRAPTHLEVTTSKRSFRLSLQPARYFLIGLQAVLRKEDPDLILTDYGDTWLFPQIKQWRTESGISFNSNRDEAMEVHTRPGSSYFSYGQVIYRGAQSHLFGRWHIDRKNAMLFGEYGLAGVAEQARVTGLPMQEVARKSPGAGITAMQMLTALETDVLVPVKKQQAEGRKSLGDLIRADRGGLIYQPIIGLHHNVAQIDFASMYPSIIVGHNISPETGHDPTAPKGLVPQTLQPLLEKRLALKGQLLKLNKRDCRYAELKARSAALKWLLVVCFGYLGYKNARFGRIEGHEAVTGISRELMMQAKEVAEELGFRVLHMYVDSLFVQQEGYRENEDFTPLLEAITKQTSIPILLEGVYRWLVFPASRRDPRVPVPNRYFGAFLNGEIKARGIAVRRRDTCAFVAETQWEVLEILGQVDDPAEMYDEARQYLQKQVRALRKGRIPPEKLVVMQKLTRELEAYRVPSPAARAAQQLVNAGKGVKPGQMMRFVYTRDKPGVWALDGGAVFEMRRVDVARYRLLLEREISVLFQENGGKTFSGAWYQGIEQLAFPCNTRVFLNVANEEADQGEIQLI
jgi:DNA polymerase II